MGEHPEQQQEQQKQSQPSSLTREQQLLDLPQDQFVECFTEFYKIHNPERVDFIPDILQKYSNRQELLNLLMEKYNVLPEVIVRRDVAPTSTSTTAPPPPPAAVSPPPPPQKRKTKKQISQPFTIPDLLSLSQEEFAT